MSSLRPTVDFLLYDWLHADRLQERPRFADHSRETFDAVLDTCERIAREKYAPFNRLVDTEEPRFDGEKVILPRATHEAHDAYVASGMLSAAQDYEIGGMQLPYTVEAAAGTFFATASVSIGGGLLTIGNANLLLAHGTDLQKQVFALNEFNGRFSGTMCLSEPQAGSSLSDVAPASTSCRRTSSTWCWPRFPARTASWCRARAAFRCSSCPRRWWTPKAGSPVSATTSRWPA
jgi:alkylation response protein AidB-like acyl-CoA dehydrogenase